MKNDFEKAVIAQLISEREMRDLTQSQIAEKMKMSKERVSQFETGYRFSTDFVSKYMEALGISTRSRMFETIVNTQNFREINDNLIVEHYFLQKQNFTELHRDFVNLPTESGFENENRRWVVEGKLCLLMQLHDDGLKLYFIIN